MSGVRVAAGGRVGGRVGSIGEVGSGSRVASDVLVGSTARVGLSAGGIAVSRSGVEVARTVALAPISVGRTVALDVAVGVGELSPPEKTPAAIAMMIPAPAAPTAPIGKMIFHGGPPPAGAGRASPSAR